MSDPTEIRRLLTSLRLDASGECGRMSSADMYRLSDLVLALLAASPALCGQMVRTGTGSTTCTREFGHMGLCDWKPKRVKRKDCKECDGTGRIHSHNDICQECEP